MIQNPVVTPQEADKSIYGNSGVKSEENYEYISNEPNCNVSYYKTGEDGEQVEVSKKLFS